MAPYRWIEHTADLAFEAEGEDWAGLIAAATEAIGAAILAPDDRESDRVVPTAVEGADREDVLVAWLGEALWRFEQEGIVPRGARLARADERAAAGDLIGRRIDPGQEPPDRVVKAVTYHDLKVVAGGPGRPWRATVVLDL